MKCEDLVKIIIRDDLEKLFQIGSQLPHHEIEDLIEFLRRNIDVFAWNAYEAPGVDPEFICHHLKVNPLIPHKKQPLGAHPKNTLKQCERKYLSLNKLELLRKFFYPE